MNSDERGKPQQSMRRGKNSDGADNAACLAKNAHLDFANNTHLNKNYIVKMSHSAEQSEIKKIYF